MSDEEFYEQFHRKGGDYLMPDRVFEDLLYEKEELEKENKKLKKELEKSQKPQIFIDTQDMEERYAEGKYQDYLEEQVKELKKQLEELKIHNPNYTPIVTLKKTIEHLYTEQEHLLNQQQEFIKYLENCIKEYTPNLRINEFDKDGNRIAQYINAEVFNKQPIEVIKEILQKYEEIIGNDINVGSNGGK